MCAKGRMMALVPNTTRLLDQPDCGKADDSALAEATYEGGVAAMAQADPKKLGKEKKPDANLVSLVFPDR
jgi:hypothetical protein